jgi:hypothetical protein
VSAAEVGTSLRRRTNAETATPITENVTPTQNAQLNPPVSASARLAPSDNSVSECVLEIVAAIATPSAPPTCCEVFSSPEATPAMRSSKFASAASETGMPQNLLHIEGEQEEAAEDRGADAKADDVRDEDGTYAEEVERHQRCARPAYRRLAELDSHRSQVITRPESGLS